ncbi:MAG: hypothetical protein KGO53_15215, partial [Alphaproteobacteria bacterium]|nr:hypothetical protein [Alphaproteobacteria bacterium]
INRQGVPLDTLQLLSAWTWSEDFQLQEQFADLAEELLPYGFGEVGIDTNLLLRCSSAVLVGDATPEALVTLKGSEVRASFEKVFNGVKYAVDFLKKNFYIANLSNLPYSTMLVPLCVFFATEGNKEIGLSADQTRQIKRWFWRCSISRRYSSGVIRNLKEDIEQFSKLREGKKSDLGAFAVSIDETFFLENTFGMGSVNTKTFILMLCQKSPLSLISGQPVDLDSTLKASNRNEYHHLMPKAFLEATKQDAIDESALANFCFITRAENRKLGGIAPSKYQKELHIPIDQVLARSMIPLNLFDDDYVKFVKARSAMLAQYAGELCSQ